VRGRGWGGETNEQKTKKTEKWACYAIRKVYWKRRSVLKQQQKKHKYSQLKYHIQNRNIVGRCFHFILAFF